MATTDLVVIDLCPAVIDLCGPPASAAVKSADGRKRKPADGSGGGGGDAARPRRVVSVPDLLREKLPPTQLQELYNQWLDNKLYSDEGHLPEQERVKQIIKQVDIVLRTVCKKACVSSVRKLALRTRGARSADGAGGVRSGGGEPDHAKPWRLTNVYSSGSPWAPNRPPAVYVGDSDDDNDPRDPFQPLRALTPLVDLYAAIAKVAMSPGVVKTALDVLSKMLDVVPLRCWVFFHQDGARVDGGTTVGGHAVHGDWRDAALVSMLNECVGYSEIGFELLEAGSDAGSVPTSTGLLPHQVLGPEDFSRLLRLGVLYAFSALAQYGRRGRFYKDGRGHSRRAAREWLMELVHSGRLIDDDGDYYYYDYGDHVPWSLAGLLLDALYRHAEWQNLEDLAADKRAKFTGM
jgi:hypothetical protein